MLKDPHLTRWIEHSRPSILGEADQQCKAPFDFTILTAWLMNLSSVQLQEQSIAQLHTEPTLASDSTE
jgi:hypothetical protein